MKVAIIKYNAGNIYSVYCACRRLGHDAVITDDPVVIRQRRVQLCSISTKLALPT